MTREEESKGIDLAVADTVARNTARLESHRLDRKRQRFEAATMVTGYDSSVFCCDLEGSRNQGYFHNLQELIDYAKDIEFALPEFAFCCVAEPYPGIDMDYAIESSCEEMFEGAQEHLKGIEELRSACEAFKALNADVCNYDVDWTRKVAVR